MELERYQICIFAKLDIFLSILWTPLIPDFLQERGYIFVSPPCQIQMACLFISFKTLGVELSVHYQVHDSNTYLVGTPIKQVFSIFSRMRQI